MTIVLLTPFEAMRIASGNSMVSTTTTGEEVQVRLFTVDEFLVAHTRACESMGLKPTLTRREAEDLVRQL